MEIEQVKEYFKNAKIVKDNDGDTVDFSKTNIDDMCKSTSGLIYIDNHNGNGVRLWSSELGRWSSELGYWSEIVEYTIPREWKATELEYYSDQRKKWIVLGLSTTRVRFKPDDSEKILTLENQKLDIERQIAELRC